MTTFPQIKAFEDEVAGAAIGLPLRGKVYAFPTALPFELGLKMRVMTEEAHRAAKAVEQGIEYRVKDGARELFGDKQMHEVYRELIGESMLETLVADGVTWPETLHIGETLFLYHTAGLEVALMVWQSAEPAEGDANPPVRRPAARSGSTGRKTSRTSSTKKKPNATNARQSRGQKSSQSGT